MNENKDPYSLREIFQRMELDLIVSMRRTFKLHQKEEVKEGFQWVQWQLIKLRNLAKYRKNNKKIVGEYSKPIKNAIDDVLQENFNSGQSNVENTVNILKNAGIEFPDKNDMPVIKLQNIENKNTEISSVGDIMQSMKDKVVLPKASESSSFFAMNEKKLKVLQDSVKNDLRNGEQAVLRQMDDVYRQTIYKTHVYLQSGAASLNKAVDMATKDFLEKGINCIQYKNGNRVSIASYAEMALRTASQRATFMGEGTKRDEFGIHTVVVSAHANTCKLCLPWQGKVLIDDVYSHGSKIDGKYPLLSEAMAAGLFHPNCRHTLATYFPGITKLLKVPDEKETLKNYKAEQQQRYMERQIRKWKRIEAGSCDVENEKQAADKVKEWQSKLRQHLKDNPQLRRDYEREKPGNDISNKDIKKNTGLLKQQAENVKIEEIREFIKSDKQPLTIEEGKQGKHILGHNNYTEGRSYLTISQEEAQELVNKYAGKGTFEFDRNGNIKNKELIMADKIIGANIDNSTGEKSYTNRFYIHYSKNGTHIVPTLKGADKK